MNTAQTNVRLGIEGDAETQRRMRETGQVGDRALKQIADASVPASGGLKAVNAASQEGQAALKAYAAQAGPVGSILTSIGPAGFAAAAGIGALVAGMRGAAGAAQEFAGINRSAQELGTSLQTLQEVRGLALLGSGGDSDAADEGLATFFERMSEARQGSADAAESFARLGVSVVDVNGKLRDGKAVMLDVADGLERLDSGAERLELRRILFGDTDGKAFVALDKGREAVEALIAEARSLGLVLDEDMIRKGAEVQRQMTITSRVIDLNLKQAFIELAPIMVASAELAGKIAGGINDIRDSVVELERMSLRGLKAELAEFDRSAKEMRKVLDEGAYIPSIKKNIPLEGRARQRMIDDLTEVEIQRAEIAAMIKSREPIESAVASLPGLPPALPDTGAKTRDTAEERRAAIRAMADALEDIEQRNKAIALIEAGQVDAAQDMLRLAEQRASVERAMRDARREGEADGLKGAALENVVRAAEIEATTANAAAESQRALSDARSAASKRESDAAAQAAKDAAERARLDAGALAATKRLAEQTVTLTHARRDAGFVAAAAADAGLAADREALKVVEMRLQRDRDAASIRAAGDTAARGAGEFDDATALRAKAEAIATQEIETRKLNETYRENRRIVAGREDAVRSLAAAEQGLADVRRDAAPVLAALDEVAAARSLADLETLRDRIEAEGDLAKVRAAGDAAARAAKEFEDPTALRQIAEARAEEVIALREGNEALADRTRVLRDQEAARKSLAEAETRLSNARAAAAPGAQAAAAVGGASNIVDFKAILAERKRQEDALAIIAAGDAAARGAGEYGDPERLRAVAEEMARITQARRDDNDMIAEARKALEDQAAAQAKMTEAVEQTRKASDDANRALVAGFASAIEQADSFEDALRRIALQVAEVAVNGLVKGASGDLSGGNGFLGDVFAGIGGSIFGNISPFGSFDGGGHTGNGPRSGGLDGKGGFMAMLHPQETVIDHTRGQSSGSSMSVHNSFQIITSDPNTQVVPVRDSRMTKRRDANKAMSMLG